MKRFIGGILLAALLLAGIVSTGTALVTTTHESRNLFREREALRREEDRLRGDWSALRIEVTYLSGHSEIDKAAREQLGMVDPEDQLQYLPVIR